MNYKIIPPTNCPSCNSILVIIKDQLFCENNQCEAKKSKAVENFCKTLKIKGFGPATINKLGLVDIFEIYTLDWDIVTTILGEKISIKLQEEVENSKKANLNDLLPALGIPLVGKSASSKLCGVISSLEEVSEEKCKEAGLGPVVTKNLLNNITDSLITSLKGCGFSLKAENTQKQNELKGIVCISGKLKSFKTKAEAQKVLEELGYLVKSSLTKDVTILINESASESAKTKKARDTGIPIITNLKELIG